VLLGIDHLVIAVRDPDAEAAGVERAIGLAFTGGGRHEGSGTFNRLAFLGDTYVELIGVFDAGLVRSSPAFAVGGATLALLDAGREGLATFALATDDVTGDVARLRAAGSAIGEPVAGSRTRPDGDVVRWITAFPALGPGEPPFLIEHEPRGAEWSAEARAARAAFRHPVGGRVRLAGLSIPVGDPAAARDRYERTVGLRFERTGRATIGGQVIELRTASRGGTLPIVDLAGEPATPPLDVVASGVRWRRSASGDARSRDG